MTRDQLARRVRTAIRIAVTWSLMLTLFALGALAVVVLATAAHGRIEHMFPG